jgi:GMP synthase-like glutamine amidotransferase
MKLGLIECDHVDERFRAIAGGYPDMFEALLRPHLPDMQFELIDACHLRLPKSPDEYDAYVCTGSRQSIYDADPWIVALKAFIRELKEAGRPFVGVCFGHQALAAALGGSVAKAQQGWGVGALEIDLIHEAPWMDPALRTCRMHYMHQDQVQQLPSDARLLARGEHCEVALFSVGDTMLGIEGHPEFPVKYMEALLLDRVERIGRERVDRGLESLHQPTDDVILAKWIARFLAR